MDAQKWAEKPLGRPQAPFVCPIGHYQGRCPVATELLQGRWPLVTGAVLYGLRLSALGLMVVSYFAGGSLFVSHRRRQFVIEPQIRFSL